MIPRDIPVPDCDHQRRLLELQLRVARRADELASSAQKSTGLNLHYWILAEAEVLGVRWTDLSAQMKMAVQTQMPQPPAEIPLAKAV